MWLGFVKSRTRFALSLSAINEVRTLTEYCWVGDLVAQSFSVLLPATVIKHWFQNW